MNEVIEKVRKLIEEKWEVTNETSNRVYFKYEYMRGAPKFYFDKSTLDVVRTDKSKESSKEAISVEVKTAIYSLFKDGVKSVDAQTVFSKRHDEETLELLRLYGGTADKDGGASK